MKNILSIDLESFVHMDIDNKLSSEQRKNKDNKYIIKATEDILKLLKKYNQKATFFIIAEIYDWYPNLIKKIKKQGHEIALHTYSHKKLKNKEILEKELKKAEKFIGDFKPKGFRAPQVYFKEDYFELLEKYNFKYDSSSYGGKTKKYGKILEIPVSTYKPSKKEKFPRVLTTKLLISNPPIGSGYLIGLLGDLIMPFIKGLNKKNIPYVMFIHPWQIRKHPYKTMNPRLLPYRINRKKTFENLLKKFKFAGFEDFIKNNKLF